MVIALGATLSARAALTVTATNGVDSLTLAFDAAAGARELWCAWDDAALTENVAEPRTLGDPVNEVSVTDA